ncbi:hypothetical protein J14TS2_00680 [Bacillus sp. J14TS2]|uniref:glycerophosphodiester phosphodiesterase n=1 Tax=Bacillus sp. J14TS2 TaxID=2807188 RepID=UPI001B29CE0B|nr:glycerophosphodiester phosphodiesterase [Bacillus sp. J14TS2]GIN69593.1 hypothetical protein J14TS2_00680 [Bacillus sp. J14TS2]
MVFPLITAHTGCMNQPDNSWQSILSAFKSDADILEEDVRATKDGEAVLFHDDHLIDTSGRSWQISQMTMEELEQLEVITHHGARENAMRIVRLEQLLILLKGSGKRANLDIKDNHSPKRVAELVKHYSLFGQVLLSGCEEKRARYVAEKYPDLKMLLNVNEKLFKTHSYIRALDQTCEAALSTGCFGININYKLCRKELVTKAQELGLHVYVWTVMNQDDMLRMAKLEVDSITTKNVPELLRLKRDWIN